MQTTLSSQKTAEILNRLHQGMDVRVPIQGREHVVRYDGTYYRTGVMRASTLERLIAVVAKAVR